ncbi:MAG: hypothetical protein J0I47_01025 [Sphingomonas sp.]|uniref:copper homeostasis protein CutC n=1 Tax=Sphingomonas sp. TaxID=28214 RepID=UPI001ACA4BD0|nr:copper homeostasis protein CutC [Sphingomonas sp.]MBN8806810.1 hypothetical protein [Sphingomonas sp.]
MTSIKTDAARILEICVESPRSVAAAIAGGADQVELCAALAIGGLTPSAGLAQATIELCRVADVKVRAMVRVRPGDFTYDADELALSLADARTLIAAGVDGVVFGAVHDDALDVEALTRFVDAARTARGDIGLTLHRAIDVVADPVAAVEQAIALGFDQILSSGGQATAWTGRATLARMVDAAASRCRIVAGAGVQPDLAAQLLTDSQVDGLHGTARGEATPIAEDRLCFGINPAATDAAIVQQLRQIIDSTCI